MSTFHKIYIFSSLSPSMTKVIDKIVKIIELRALGLNSFLSSRVTSMVPITNHISQVLKPDVRTRLSNTGIQHSWAFPSRYLTWQVCRSTLSAQFSSRKCATSQRNQPVKRCNSSLDYEWQDEEVICWETLIQADEFEKNLRWHLLQRFLASSTLPFWSGASVWAPSSSHDLIPCYTWSHTLFRSSRGWLRQVLSSRSNLAFRVKWYLWMIVFEMKYGEIKWDDIPKVHTSSFVQRTWTQNCMN